MEIRPYLHSTPNPLYINNCGHASYLKRQSISQATTAECLSPVGGLSWASFRSRAPVGCCLFLYPSGASASCALLRL